jgi:hypothetical protein
MSRSEDVKAIGRINRKIIALFNEEDIHPAVASAAFVQVMASILVTQTAGKASAIVGADTISRELHKSVISMFDTHFGMRQ